jgi:hypothetical protein
MASARNYEAGEQCRDVLTVPEMMYGETWWKKIHLLLKHCVCKICNDMVAMRTFDLIFGLVATAARYVKFVTVVNHKPAYTLRISCRF